MTNQGLQAVADLSFWLLKVDSEIQKIARQLISEKEKGSQSGLGRKHGTMKEKQSVLQQCNRDWHDNIGHRLSHISRRNWSVAASNSEAEKKVDSDDEINRQDLLQSWSHNSQNWTTAVRTDQIGSRKVATNQAIIDTIFRYDVKTVLDLGCGEGWLTRCLEAKGIRTTGIDGSQALIEAAKSAGAGIFHTISYKQLADKPLQLSEKYDAIVANFSLLDDRVGETLEALHSFMPANGVVIIQTVHPLTVEGNYIDGWRREDFASFENANTKKWQPMPWYFRTLSSWLQTLRTSGFSLIDFREPIHPKYLKPLSLIFAVEKQEKISI